MTHKATLCIQSLHMIIMQAYLKISFFAIITEMAKKVGPRLCEHAPRPDLGQTFRHLCT